MDQETPASMPIKDPGDLTPLEALNLAIKQAGGIVKCAGTMGVTVYAISGWRRRGLPSDRVPGLERISGVPMKRLRPDLYR